MFVVGDEKQSIFSFQGAAPERLQPRRCDQALSGERRSSGAGRAGVRRRGAGLLDAVLALDAGRCCDRSSTPCLREPTRAWRTAAAASAEPVEGRGRRAIRHIADRSDGPARRPLAAGARAEGEEREAWDEPLDAEGRRGAYRRLAERIAGEIKALVERGEAVFDKETRALARRPATATC